MAYGHAKKRNKTIYRQGFTIVELLIVVVVIAILAAITIVAYNGIQNRAKMSASQSAAQQAAKKILAFAVDNAESYPDPSGTAGIDNLQSIGIVNSSATTYQYSANNTVSPRTFCITATTNNVSYYVSQSVTKPSSGACPGHGVNGIAAITNLSTNPALGSNSNSYSGAGSISGAARVAVSDLPNFSWAWQANSTAVSDRVFSSNASGVNAGTVYTASLWAKYTVGSSATIQATDSSGNTVYQSASCGSQANTWQRCSVTFTPSASSWRIALRQTSSGSGTIAITGVMLTEGSSIPNYADGNSTNWVWNGTTNNSTSTGPAV